MGVCNLYHSPTTHVPNKTVNKQIAHHKTLEKRREGAEQNQSQSTPKLNHPPNHPTTEPNKIYIPISLNPCILRFFLPSSPSSLPLSPSSILLLMHYCISVHVSLCQVGQMTRCFLNTTLLLTSLLFSTPPGRSLGCY